MAYINAIEYSSASAMREAARAVHQRLWRSRAMRPEPISTTVETVQIAPEPIDPIGNYRIIDIYSTHEEPSFPALKGTAREYLMRRSVELGFTFGEIISARRRRELVKARHELIAEVYHKFPKLSLPAIGRLFCKDHTSMLAALRKMGEHGRPKPAISRASIVEEHSDV